VPVALTEFSKRELVRELTRDECRAALAQVAGFAGRAMSHRGTPWAFGADELYLRAGEPLPPGSWYGDFEQRENGVGAVRYLQAQIAAGRGRYGGWSGKRVGIVTGTAMAPLMPQVVQDLARETGAHIEILPVENSLFGASVTTAGLLPGSAIGEALVSRTDLDATLLPAESVNDDLLFMDDVHVHALAERVPMPLHLSYDFADVMAR
jgi:NifB/MoaA-like Fe-S oxidoreductase